MSYNNIGLSTPRGSGTSGYITRNVSHIKPRGPPVQPGRDFEDGSELAKDAWRKEPAKEIAEHDLKRQIEVKCMELRDQLEDEGVDEDEIEKRVGYLRESLAKRSSSTPARRSQQRRL
ncbi:cwf21 domain-containing protein [Lipomyces tetrasporus]|uniref:Pre-mRNA-splicing factor CWC21 n=1 Tax=Lipomyces tetrasporus TaxID=54092 RepID=A0AAD7QUK3_9ASCO|nr:cwf21 domain-containing protein [Lipomyces tetrasporus]KAJ8101256.1 cwf21 domain-containing protein [Lipomyces tetrasporus]